MPESIKFLDKNRTEFTMLTVGGFFLSAFLYFFYKEINIEIIKSISVTERVIVATIVSYVLGNIFYIVGNYLAKITTLIFVQDNKLVFVKNIPRRVGELMSSGYRKVVVENDEVLRSEFYEYLERNRAINEEYGRLVFAERFWATMLGGCIVILWFAYYYHASVVTPILICCFSLYAELHYNYRASIIWEDMGKKIIRENIKQK